MKRQYLMLFVAAALVCATMTPANAAGGRGGKGGHGGISRGHGQKVNVTRSFAIGHNFKGNQVGFGSGGFGCGGFGFGFGGYNDICGYAQLYRELYNNLPYFALHPPVYYSYPVPRTYGYSPFAYPPGTMTPDILGASGPVEIINPHVPSSQQKPADEKTDRTASYSAQPEPLVIVNPYVDQQIVAQSHE